MSRSIRQSIPTTVAMEKRGTTPSPSQSSQPSVRGRFRPRDTASRQLQRTQWSLHVPRGQNHNGTVKEHARAGKGFALSATSPSTILTQKPCHPLGRSTPTRLRATPPQIHLAGATKCDPKCLQRQIEMATKKMDVPADATLRRSKQFGGGTSDVREATPL